MPLVAEAGKHLSEADVALGLIIFIDHYVKRTPAE